MATESVADLRLLRIGMTRAEVRAALGASDREGGTSRRRCWSIHTYDGNVDTYGNVELHFTPEGTSRGFIWKRTKWKRKTKERVHRSVS